MDEENITSETLSGEASESVDKSSDGTEAVGSVTQNALTLEEVNSILGKNFKDKDTALKALKDTYNYVGKAGQVEKELEELKSKSSVKPEGDYIARDEFETEMFFKDNPDHAQNRELVSSLAKAHGVSVKEAVELDAYKTVFEKAKGYDESQNTKSVLESNPRLGSARSRMEKATDSIKEANQAFRQGDVYGGEKAHSTAKSEAVRAVLDVYEE